LAFLDLASSAICLGKRKQPSWYLAVAQGNSALCPFDGQAWIPERSRLDHEDRAERGIENCFRIRIFLRQILQGGEASPGQSLRFARQMQDLPKRSDAHLRVGQAHIEIFVARFLSQHLLHGGREFFMGSLRGEQVAAPVLRGEVQ
jgi:hypothetical protein